MAKPKFSDFLRGIESEAEAEGAEAVEELAMFREYFRLARQMATARKAKGLSQQQLAERCGLNQSEISDMERGRANPTFASLQRVAHGLGFRVGLVAISKRRPKKVAAKKTTTSRRQTAAR